MNLPTLAFSMCLPLWVPQLPDVEEMDLLRFPVARLARQNYFLGYDYCQYLDACHECGALRDNDHWVLSMEARQLRKAWDLLDDAHRFQGEVRLEKLRELRDYLGPMNFWMGRMPPPLPVWRFQSCDR